MRDCSGLWHMRMHMGIHFLFSSRRRLFGILFFMDGHERNGRMGWGVCCCEVRVGLIGTFTTTTTTAYHFITTHYIRSTYCDNNSAIDAAVALCTGKVGCSSLSHKYSLTGYSQLAFFVYQVGVPLSLVSPISHRNKPTYSLYAGQYAVTFFNPAVCSKLDTSSITLLYKPCVSCMNTFIPV